MRRITAVTSSWRASRWPRLRDTVKAIISSFDSGYFLWKSLKRNYGELVYAAAAEEARIRVEHADHFVESPFMLTIYRSGRHRGRGCRRQVMPEYHHGRGVFLIISRDEPAVFHCEKRDDSAYSGSAPRMKIRSTALAGIGM